METLVNNFLRLKTAIAALPVEVQHQKINELLKQQIPFFETCKVNIEEWSQQRCIFSLENHKAVQNNIQTIQAAAIILVPESAMALLVGANIQDNKIVLSKKVSAEFLKKAKGKITATATLSTEQKALLQSTEKGEMILSADALDEQNEIICHCESHWVWYTKS